MGAVALMVVWGSESRSLNQDKGKMMQAVHGVTKRLFKAREETLQSANVAEVDIIIKCIYT
jgi:hypothetical protein